MIRKRKRLWAMILSAALVVTQLPAVAMAENAPEDGAVASFEALPGDVAKQTVTLGTQLGELNLPDTVTAHIYQVMEEEIPDEDITEDNDVPTASPSDADGSVSGGSIGISSVQDSGKTVTTVTTSPKEITVTWDSEPAYDGDMEGKYVFTADVGGYTLSGGARLPQIIVTVSADTSENPAENPTGEPLHCTKTEGCALEDGHEGPCVPNPPANDALVKTITGWTFVEDGDNDSLTGGELALPGVSMEQQADFGTIVSMLPTQIRAEIEGEPDPETLDITWECAEYRQDGNGNWPLTGGYTFTAVLPKGCVCEPLPAVQVLIGGGLYAVDKHDDLTITGGEVIVEADGQIILRGNNAAYEISGTWNGTLDSVDRDNPKAVITVPAGVTANVTLKDVTIDISSKRYACAFAVKPGGTANITLDGTNTVKSGGGRAGLEVPEGARLTIEGTDGDNLTATGDGGGAGIGGGGGMTGSGGSGGTITITGGEVTATGSSGIGGGSIGLMGGIGGIGGTVRISGMGTVVTATGNGNNGYDVGGGGAISGSQGGGSLSVTNGAVLEMKNTGTNVTDPVYVGCTIKYKDGKEEVYPLASPTLTLTANPSNSLTLSDDGKVTLTATLSDAFPDNSGKTIIFTVNDKTHVKVTDSSGAAAYTITNPSHGTYTFGASFEGDELNDSVSAADITGYTVNYGTQEALTLNGLGSAYTYGDYGDEAIHLSISGGSGNGAVSYTSSDPSVARVTGNTVTILKAGTFTITAAKAGDTHYQEAKVTSGVITVSEATPNVSLNAAGGTTTSEALILTATVTKTGTGVTPAGTVTFSKNGIPMETTALNSSGEASYTVSSPEAGSHTYTAEYSGQIGYYFGASVSRTIGVELTGQTGFAIRDPGAKTYGDSDFSLTAAGGQGTGSVSFSAPEGNGVLAVEADGKVKITGVGKVAVTATKDADSTYNQATATLEISVAPRDIINVTVNVTGDRVYTGSQLQPVFEVEDGALAITAGDYTNSYGSNAAAGTGAGSIILTGQHNYTGTKTVAFDIEKRPLTGAVITLEAASYPYTGSEIRPAVTKAVVDGVMVPAAAYDVSYQNNINAGTATVTVTAKAGGNYSGSAGTTFMITASGGTDGSHGGESDESSGHSSGATDDRTHEAQKGWVSAQTGIITGSGSGYSEWTADENGWKLRYTDGTIAAGKSMAAGDGGTYEVLTWELINGAWYAFGADGYAKSGMVFDPVLGGYFYIDINTGMKTGWQLINGAWYYFNPVSDGKKGILVTDAWIDGWYVDKNGIWNGEEDRD